MEKQEFCMEKSQIFQEMISRISKLSQDSYLMVTDMQHNLTFVPESTAEFLGIPSGWCEDGYKIVLEKSVHPYDCPTITGFVSPSWFKISSSHFALSNKSKSNRNGHEEACAGASQTITLYLFSKY